MAGRNLNRLVTLNESSGPDAAAEYDRIVAVLGEDVVAEYLTSRGTVQSRDRPAWQ